ncbi:MAG: peptidylprolyl isomerase [Planctomycetes bacterium]|nr:peptidylprolyl isomerase [Planctomycetota bacterium]
MSKTRVVLVTNHGEMTLSFRPDKAPNHVANFLKLCKQGFYDGTKFHRVIRNFMIQGGDPNTKDDDKQHLWGQGGPGWNVNAEFNDIKHVRGVLSMARSTDPNSAGSQFYIVHKDAPHLDNQYTAFGNLESGADVLDSIANTKTGRGDIPINHVVLQAAVILPVFK